MTACPCVGLVPMLVVAASACAASALAAEGRSPLEPFWGTMTGEVRWAATDVCQPHQPVQTLLASKGDLTGLGRSALSGAHCATSDGGAVGGLLTFAAANGDRVQARYQARLLAESDTLLVEEMSVTFVDGGTGRFARASGNAKGTVFVHKSVEPPTLTSVWPIDLVLAGTIASDSSGPGAAGVPRQGP